MTFFIIGTCLAAALVGLIIRAVRQFRAYDKLGAATGPRAFFPTVGVVVPARNEADVIGRCITGLRRQDYPADRVRMVVVDDGSSDGTAALARAAAGGDRRLSVIAAGALPDGWNGKSHACWRGAQRLRDCAYLCFLDADTEPQRPLLRSAVAAAADRGIDLLSLEPWQELGSVWERLVLPAGMLVLAYQCDLRKTHDQASEAATANGQFLLLRSRVYWEIGGHAAIRGAISEDSATAQRVKSAGYRIAVMDGAPLIRVRMYRSFAALWRGISKQSVDALGGAPRVLLVSLLGVPLAWAVLLGPLVMAARLPAHSGALAVCGVALAVAAALSALGLHLACARYFRLPLGYGLLFPLGYSLAALMAADGLRRQWQGRMAWKGRDYSVQRGPETERRASRRSLTGSA